MSPLHAPPVAEPAVGPEFSRPAYDLGYAAPAGRRLLVAALYVLVVVGLVGLVDFAEKPAPAAVVSAPALAKAYQLQIHCTAAATISASAGAQPLTLISSGTDQWQFSGALPSPCTVQIQAEASDLLAEHPLGLLVELSDGAHTVNASAVQNSVVSVELTLP